MSRNFDPYDKLEQLDPNYAESNLSFIEQIICGPGMFVILFVFAGALYLLSEKFDNIKAYALMLYMGIMMLPILAIAALFYAGMLGLLLTILKIDFSFLYLFVFCLICKSIYIYAKTK